jgi:hypothetical protein
MRCEYCRALCRETDGRCHGCGEPLPVGFVGNLPAIGRWVGTAAGAIALPVLLYNPKAVPTNTTFAVTAALAGGGAVAGRLVGYVLGVLLAWVVDGD